MPAAHAVERLGFLRGQRRAPVEGLAGGGHARVGRGVGPHREGVLLEQLDDPALVRVMDELARKVVASGRILGISMGFDPGRVAAWIGRGVSLMSLGIDIEILIAGARNLRGAVDRQLAVPAPAGGRARAARRRPARKG